MRARLASNRLFALNTGATHIESGQFDLAERDLAAAIAATDLRSSSTILGEEALWYLKLGTARAGTGRMEEARRDLTRALVSSPREWVKGRAHLELARLALRTGDAHQARRQVAEGLQSSERGGDGRAVTESTCAPDSHHLSDLRPRHDITGSWALSQAVPRASPDGPAVGRTSQMCGAIGRPQNVSAIFESWLRGLATTIVCSFGAWPPESNARTDCRFERPLGAGDAVITHSLGRFRMNLSTLIIGDA